MKSFVLTAALAATTLAQTYRSPSFYLEVLSATNSTLNGTTLDACHEGAAIEGFCRGPRLSSSGGDLFYFNTSSPNTNPKAADVYGALAYDLNTTSLIVPSPMRLGLDPTTNIAVPVLYPDPDTYQSVYFDSNNLLYILSSKDDTVNPAVNKEEKLYQWYICETYYAYTYETLAWVVGKGVKPENPTCQKVSVKRVWAT